MEPEHGGDAADNARHPWDDFDSDDYFGHNYGKLRHDDHQILLAIRDFFTEVRSDVGTDGADGHPARGLDLGSGTNLYPALAMLPFCAEVTLWEYAATNVEWLRRQIKSYSSTWDQFWSLLKPALPYQATPNPRATLAERAVVHQGSVFDLPAAGWDLGTMFFVAESLTSDRTEFEAATHRFVGALRPGAPFAAAFMEGSTGYEVGSYTYPAVSITRDDVRDCLTTVAGDLDIRRIDPGNEPLREGYSGMILVLGTAGAD